MQGLSARSAGVGGDMNVMKAKYFLLIVVFFSYETTAITRNDDSGGKAFVLTFPYHMYNANADIIGIPSVFVSTQIKNTVVMTTVSVPGIEFNQSANLTSVQNVNIVLPHEAAFYNVGYSAKRSVAVIVTATDVVSVHGYYGAYRGYDGFFVLPTTALDNEYFAVGYPFAFYSSEFAVTAIEDNTTVVIKGQPPVSLQQYESYQFFGDDVTGLLITADKPVSVISGHQCAKIPSDSSSSCDYIMENIPPVKTLGNHYLLTPFLGRTSGYVYRIVAALSGITNVTISGRNRTVVSLSAGQFYEGNVASDEMLVVTADNSIMVAQYAKGGRDTDGVGDPFMVVIPPTQRFTNNVTFPVVALTSLDNDPPWFVTRYFLSIISGCDSMNSFHLDETPLGVENISLLQTTPDGEYCVLRTPVNPGFHSVTHPLASFLVLVYGFAYRRGYGYAAGYNVHSGDAAALTSAVPQYAGCLPFSKPAQGTLVPDRDLYGYGESVTVYCRQGFGLQGDEVLVCLDSGLWHGQIPTCSTSPNSTSSISTIIIACVVGGLVVIIILVILLVLYRKRNNPSTSGVESPVHYSTTIADISNAVSPGNPPMNYGIGRNNIGYEDLQHGEGEERQSRDYQGLYAVVS
ncbi:uncharacterized protein [Amphiura filiformis]|uniref:uncharacterized protein n=1 Tax=Amphiura filiformis TaxID=82378 RepID=UPI003B20F310